MSSVLAEFNRLYRTGDFASMRKDGSIQYEGRTDSQIKVRGHRVDLSEVEKQLCGLTALVDKGVVLCYRPGEIDQALVAFVVALATKTPLSQDTPIGMDIEAALRDRLADYMLPQVLVLDTMPLLVNGKVDRQALLKTYENSNNNGNGQRINANSLRCFNNKVVFFGQMTTVPSLNTTLRTFPLNKNQWPRICSKPLDRLLENRRDHRSACIRTSTSWAEILSTPYTPWHSCAIRVIASASLIS